MQENTIIVLSYKELSQIIGIYFSQKLKSPTSAEMKLLVGEEGLNVEVKLWTEKKLVQGLDIR